jgi:NAD-dependent SIR2 family protein deacetylase
MLIIGIGYKKFSGKDTLASMIQEEMGHDVCGIIHFADALKREVSAATGVSVEDINKNKDQFRPILQWWGTEFRRQFLPGVNDYWVDKVRETIDASIAIGTSLKVVLVPDTRFPNEADWIKARGGKLIKIERPSIESIDLHQSEIAMNSYKREWDMLIVNEGPREGLIHVARSIINSLIIPNL